MEDRFTFYLKPEQLVQLRKLAKEADRSLAWMVRHCVDLGLGELEDDDSHK